MIALDARIAANWTSAAGALEGVLASLDSPLPRHAVMGLSGHAWHFCLGAKGGIVALPSGPHDYDREAMARRYARTGWRFERFGGELPEGGDWTDLREAAAAWAREHLAGGRALIGWDFHLREHAVVYGYDDARAGFLVDDLLTGQAGPFVALEDWPSALGQLELVAPIEPFEPDPLETVAAALEDAIAAFEGKDGADDGQPRGTAGIEAWAAAFDGEVEVDRAGNAYQLAVLQAARLDGAAFLADLAEGLEPLSEPLRSAERALRDEGQALAPLLTLFPFPSGGHGNVANAGLRRGAAMTLRRVASHERRAAEAIAAAVTALRGI